MARKDQERENDEKDGKNASTNKTITSSPDVVKTSNHTVNHDDTLCIKKTTTASSPYDALRPRRHHVLIQVLETLLTCVLVPLAAFHLFLGVLFLPSLLLPILADINHVPVDNVPSSTLLVTTILLHPVILTFLAGLLLTITRHAVVEGGDPQKLPEALRWSFATTMIAGGMGTLIVVTELLLLSRDVLPWWTITESPLSIPFLAPLKDVFLPLLAASILLVLLVMGALTIVVPRPRSREDVLEWCQLLADRRGIIFVRAAAVFGILWVGVSIGESVILDPYMASILSPDYYDNVYRPQILFIDLLHYYLVGPWLYSLLFVLVHWRYYFKYRAGLAAFLREAARNPKLIDPELLQPFAGKAPLIWGWLERYHPHRVPRYQHVKDQERSFKSHERSTPSPARPSRKRLNDVKPRPEDAILEARTASSQLEKGISLEGKETTPRATPSIKKVSSLSGDPIAKTGDPFTEDDVRNAISWRQRTKRALPAGIAMFFAGLVVFGAWIGFFFSLTPAAILRLPVEAHIHAIVGLSLEIALFFALFVATLEPPNQKKSERDDEEGTIPADLKIAKRSLPSSTRTKRSPSSLRRFKKVHFMAKIIFWGSSVVLFITWLYFLILWVILLLVGYPNDNLFFMISVISMVLTLVLPVYFVTIWWILRRIDEKIMTRDVNEEIKNL